MTDSNSNTNESQKTIQGSQSCSIESPKGGENGKPQRESGLPTPQEEPSRGDHLPGGKPERMNH
jgi:hypothetical protein